MKTYFVGGEKIVWQELKAAFRKARQAEVAVAFLGSGAHKRLRLRKGSTLVVNASEDVVRCGQTDPREIKKFKRSGVSVYSSESLHAKVFVLGQTAYVGSANVSATSESRLIEAVVATSDREAVGAARKFVRENMQTEIGPELLKSLLDKYRPPKYWIHGAKPREIRNFVWAVELRTYARDEIAQNAEKHGRLEAERRLSDSRSHRIDNFEWAGAGVARFRIGQRVIQRVLEKRRTMHLYPVGTIVHVERFGRKTKSRAIVFLEINKQLRGRRWGIFKAAHPAAAKLFNGRAVLTKLTNSSLLKLFPS